MYFVLLKIMYYSGKYVRRRCKVYLYTRIYRRVDQQEGMSHNTYSCNNISAPRDHRTLHLWTFFIWGYIKNTVYSNSYTKEGIQKRFIINSQLILQKLRMKVS